MKADNTITWNEIRTDRRYDGFAQVGLFLLGICVTLYLPLMTVQSAVIRPVQLVPAILGPLALLLAGTSGKKTSAAFYLWPVAWAVYMLFRHISGGADGMLEAVRSVLNVVTYLAVLRLCQSAKSEHCLLAGLFAGCLLSVAAASIGITFGETRSLMGSGRWQGFMPGANRLGNLCGICLFLGILTLFSRRSKVHTVFYCLAIGVAVLGMMMTGSRGALLAAGLALCTMLVIREIAKGRPMAAIRLIVAGLALAAVVRIGTELFGEYLPDRLVALMEGRHDALYEAQNDVRFELFSIAWEHFVSAPCFGDGISAQSLTLNNRASSAHDAYLYLLSTSGIVGLALYLPLPILLMFRLLRIAWRPSCFGKTQAARAAAAAGMLTFVAVHAVAIETSQAMHTWLVFAIAAYICTASEAGGRPHCKPTPPTLRNRHVAGVLDPRHFARQRQPHHNSLTKSATP